MVRAPMAATMGHFVLLLVGVSSVDSTWPFASYSVLLSVRERRGVCSLARVGDGSRDDIVAVCDSLEIVAKYVH